jgi:anti-sigma factor RsiW
VKCSDFLHELNNYLDGALDPRVKAELEDHLAWCHNCFVVCDTTKKTIQIFRDSEVYELPDDLRTQLHSAIMAKCQAKKRKTGPQGA